MKKVEEFQKTQTIINEYNQLENKMKSLNLSKERLSTEKSIITQTYNKGIKKEEYKGYQDFEEKLKQDIDEYHIDPRDLEKEYINKITKIDEDLEKTEKEQKYFSNDNNFKIITIEIKQMEEAIQDAKNEKNIEIAKIDLQWNELMAEKKYDEALEKRKEKETVIKKFDTGIKQLQDKKKEYIDFKEKLNEKLKDFTIDDYKMISEMSKDPKTADPKTADPKTADSKTADSKTADPKTADPKTADPKTADPKTADPRTADPKTAGTKTTDPDNIYSHSKDIIDEINIDASEGKAYIEVTKKDGTKETKEINNIDDIVKRKKEIFKEVDINDYIYQAGVNSGIKQLLIKRRANPVILEAIKEDDDLTYEYIESLVDKKEYPFKYEVDLSESALSNKSNKILNRIALRESKIEGNEVKGTQKLYTLKNIMKKLKNIKQLSGKENPKAIDAPKEEKSNAKKYREESYMGDTLKKLEEEQKAKVEEIYSELSDEQKSQIQNMGVSDIQRLGLNIEYSTASRLKETYGKNEDSKKDDSKTEETKNNDTDKGFEPGE